MEGGVSRDENHIEIGASSADNAELLDELEIAYRQMEQLLSAANYETDLAYQQLRTRNQDLQDQLAETALANHRLTEAQHMLVRSERMSAMGQMAAAIVHEINNPLSVIIGHVEMLLLNEGEQDKNVLQAIHQASTRLKGLTHNVLAFSRKKLADPRPLDLSSLANEVLGFFLPLIRHIEVQTDLATGLPEVLADAAQIEQVLTNFILNALDAMHRQPNSYLLVATGQGNIAAAIAAERAAGREVRLALEAELESLQRGCVFVEVRDRGPGITPEVMEKVFEAFFTTKGEEKGTGLGLAICRSIAEGYRGNILVASAVGAGASFRMFLPVLTGTGKVF